MQFEDKQSVTVLKVVVDVVRDIMVVDAESHTDEEALLVELGSDFLHLEVYVFSGNYDNYS
jgi:hypothetical protein